MYIRQHYSRYLKPTEEAYYVALQRRIALHPSVNVSRQIHIASPAHLGCRIHKKCALIVVDRLDGSTRSLAASRL